MSIYLPKWRQIDIFCVFYRKDLVKKDFFYTFALFFKVHILYNSISYETLTTFFHNRYCIMP